MTEKKRWKKQTTNISWGKGAFKDIRRITKGYYEQVSAHKFNNLDEVDQFVKSHKQPKLNQEGMEYTHTEIEFTV